MPRPAGAAAQRAAEQWKVRWQNLAQAAAQSNASSAKVEDPLAP